jgi:integrase
MRRSRGEGSVYKRKDGLWVAQYEIGGKRRYLYGKTKKAVTDRLREKMTSGMANLDPEAEKMRLGVFLDRWLPSVEGTVRRSTFERHEEVVRLHLKPSIGGIGIKDLGPMDVEELYRKKLRAGLSPRTVQIIHATLHKALKQALRWSLVPKNVTELVTPPRYLKKEVRTLSPEEAKRLLRTAKGERFEALYVLAVTTGMRQGELLGLKWGDLDPDKGTLKVRRTVRNGEVNPPKSASSNRSIHLTTGAMQALREHGERNGKREWVFSTRNGTPVGCANLVNRSWRPLLEKAGLPRIPFHNIRHTCASLLLSQGVHPKLVQELLGHADITTTLNTYSHVIPSLRGETASAMEDVLGEVVSLPSG